MSKIFKVIIVLIIWVIANYLFLIGASHVYVSGGLAEKAFDKNDHPLLPLNEARNKSISILRFNEIKNKLIPEFSVSRVKELNIIHAIRNLIFILSTAGIFVSISIVGFIAGIIGIIYGPISSSWEIFLGGIGLIILSPLACAILAGMGSLIMWLALLVQPCTPGYFLIMAIAGIPSLLTGLGSGGSPAITIIKIYH